MRRSDTDPAVVREHGRNALAAFDDALSHAPHKDDYSLAALSRQLSCLRDALIECQRQRGPSDTSAAQLETVNGTISLALAAHFPLGEIPWSSIRKGRDALKGLVKTL